MTKLPNARHAPPKAGAMVEALRGLGYTVATAIADIVDNSISASASKVEIEFRWKGGDSTISILDNGSGMNEVELDLAMRLGEKNPLDERSAKDLGRFGMGLKTASFSQGRRLTVASRKHGPIHALYWDLDVLSQSGNDGWHLLEGIPEELQQLTDVLGNLEQGTIVLWDKLDRVVPAGSSEQDFLDMMDVVESHLSMVFHRFLAKDGDRIVLRINGRQLRAWDPYLIGHTAGWSSPVERLATDVGLVEVQCHVLPHKDWLSDREYQIAAGPEGWTSQQGFYIYRNQRLLVAGSWIGLGRGRSWTKDEAHRLARIRVDIPNTADAKWKIDIRKSTARPPHALKERLVRIAEDTRRRARTVFAHRGQSVKTRSSHELKFAWRPEHFKGGVRYRIDETHPAIAAVLQDCGALGPQVRAMLRVLEETVPVREIWLSTAEEREVPRTGFAEAPPAEVQDVLNVMYRNLVLRQGMEPRLAKERLCLTEPFDEYPGYVAALPDQLTDG